MNDIKTLHQLDLTSDEDLLCLDADQEIKKSLGPSSENWFDILTQQKAHERRNTSKRDFLHNENREPNLSDQDDNGTPESTSCEKHIHINTINGHECKSTEEIRKCDNPIFETVTVLDQSTSATKQLKLPTSQVNHFPLKRKSDSCINTSGFKIDVERRWSCESEKNCSSKKAKLAGEFNPWIQSPTGMNPQKNLTKNKSLATHKNNLVPLPGNSQTTMKLRTSKKSVTKPSSFRQPANLKHYSSENDHGVDSDEEFLGFVELYEKQSNKKYSTMDSKITGFQTASNKGINISVKSWKKVQKLFSEDSNFSNTCESLPKQA
uniref:Uncharacterized protein n=1 Tax=Ciona savignyi TaxID=51511 RepID=H2YVJ6_CIOSA